MQNGTLATFPAMIEGAAGTISFGNGIPAFHCEVVEVGPDYVMVDDKDGDRTIAPISSVAFFRYDSEA